MSNVIMPFRRSDVIVIPISSGDALPIVEECESESVPVDVKTSKWRIVKPSNRRISRGASKGELKLSHLIDELRKFAREEQEVREDEQISITNPLNCIRFSRRRLAHFLQKSALHYIIISFVITDLIVVLVDLVLAQLSSPCLTEEELEEYNTTKQRETCLLEHSIHLIRADLFLFYFSVILLSIFVLEILLSVFAFGWKRYKSPLFLLDAIIVLSSFIMEIYFHFGNIGSAGRAASAIIVLRLWKIIRAIHAVAHSITLKNRLLIKKIREAKILLEEEKIQTEQTLEKQEIKSEYLTNILTKLGELPSKNHIDKYVNDIWMQRRKPN